MYQACLPRRRRARAGPKHTSKLIPELVERIEAAIVARRLLGTGSSVVCAVSGGLDSMVLLHVLHALAPKHGWSLAVAHFNHELRGRSSDADQRFVQESGRRLGIPFRTGRANVRQAAKRDGISVEMAGRRLRHAFLAQTAHALGSHRIALAHHADDQIELFFLRLLRGAGPEGLAGMRFESRSPAEPGVQLIRPLLEITRAELERFAQEHRIGFREDASNTQLDFLRNRVRHELLPLLRKNFQPSLNTVLRRSLDILGAEANLVSALTAQARSDGSPFEALHLAIQRRWLCAECVALGLEPEFQLIEQLRVAAGHPIEVRPNWRVWRDEAGRLHAAHGSLEQPIRRRPRTIDLQAQVGEIILAKLRICWAIKAWRGTISRLKGALPGIETFDAAKVGTRIRLRHWRPGDRFQPIGMARSVKLQDLFTNLKIPRARRSELCVAEAESGEIFWVEDLRIGEKFKVCGGTDRYLEWRWERLEVRLDPAGAAGSLWE